MESIHKKPQNYVNNLLELQKFHQVTFLTNKKHPLKDEQLKRFILLSFEKHSAKQQLKAIITINKILGFDEYSSIKSNRVVNQITQGNHFRQVFLKNKVTLKIRNIINPELELRRGMQLLKLSYLKFLVLSEVQINTMEWFNNLDAENLEDLRLLNCKFYSINGLNKALFPLLSGLTLVGCEFKDYKSLSRKKLTRKSQRQVRFVNREGLQTNKQVQFNLQFYRQFAVFRGLRHDTQDLSYVFKLQYSLTESFKNAQTIMKQYQKGFSTVYTLNKIEDQSIGRNGLQLFIFMHGALVQKSLKSISKKLFPQLNAYFIMIDQKVNRLKRIHGINQRKHKK